MAKMGFDVWRPSRTVAPSSVPCWGQFDHVTTRRDDPRAASISRQTSLGVVHGVVHVNEVPRMGLEVVVYKPQLVVQTTQQLRVEEHRSFSCPCLNQGDFRM